MRLYIKEKVFTIGDKFTVKDEHGNDRYFVEGEIFTWGKKLHVYDQLGQEAAFIKQELFTWLPRYTVYSRGEEIAQVKKEFSFFLPRYSIQGLGWEITGSPWEHDYQITEYGRLIVNIQKEWFTWGDSYVLDILDPANELIALAVVLTIDCVTENNNSGASVTVSSN